MPTDDLRDRLIARLLASWKVAGDLASQAMARRTAERDADRMLTVLAEQTDGDLRDRYAKALMAAFDKTAIVCDHTQVIQFAPLADAALAVRDAELERWRDVVATVQRRADRLQAERDVMASAVEQAREIAEKNPDNRLSPRILIALTVPTGDVHTHAQRAEEGGE